MRAVEMVRARLVERLDDAVRRPGMWSPLIGLDAFFTGLVEDLAFIDETEDDLSTAVDEVIDRRGLRSSVGMRGPIGQVIEEAAISPVVGSIWAEVGWRLGWLRLDATAKSSQFDEAAERVEAAMVRPLGGAEARALLGVVSMEARHWLASVSADGRWLYVDLDTWTPQRARDPRGSDVKADESRVRHVRLPGPSFVDGLRIAGAGM